jgi:non-ribosomal peptide synthetase component F
MDRLIALDNSAAGEGLAGLKVEQIENPSVHARFDFLWNLVDTGEALILDCTYNTDLFDADTVVKWMGRYERLLQTIAAQPEIRIDALLDAHREAEAQSHLSKLHALESARQEKFKKLKRKSQLTA